MLTFLLVTELLDTAGSIEAIKFQSTDLFVADFISKFARCACRIIAAEGRVGSPGFVSFVSRHHLPKQETVTKNKELPRAFNQYIIEHVDELHVHVQRSAYPQAVHAGPDPSGNDNLASAQSF